MKEIIHCESPLNGEYTLCGDAFDLSVNDDSEYKEGQVTFRQEGQKVTCPKCILVIKLCRKVKISRLTDK